MWDGEVQRMCFNIGVPQELIHVLKERGKYDRKMKLCDMQKEIANHPDFRDEKTRLEYYLHNRAWTCLHHVSQVSLSTQPDQALLGSSKVLH